MIENNSNSYTFNKKIKIFNLIKFVLSSSIQLSTHPDKSLLVNYSEAHFTHL